MTTLISPFANRRHFSASQMNQMSQVLLHQYAIATAPRFPFFKARRTGDFGEVPAGDWSGVIYHVSNTFRWRTTLSGGGRIKIYINGNQIIDTNTDGAAGTKDITSEGLTIGKVYTVTAVKQTDSAQVDWLGEVVSQSYTAPPAFTDGNILTPDNLTDLRARILELDTLAAQLCSPCEHIKISKAINGKGAKNGGNIYVAAAEFVYTGSTQLTYMFYHGSNGGQVNTVFELDGDIVFTVAQTTGGTLNIGTKDLSTEMSGFTMGDFHEMRVRTKIENTASKYSTFCELHYMGFESTYAPASAPNIWNHGNQDINEDNLNWYSNTIKALYPGSGLCQAGLYSEYPAVRINNNFDASGMTIHNAFYLQHRDKYLHYEPHTGMTPLLKFGSSKASLEEDDGDHVADLDQYGVGYGQYYSIDNVDYALEAKAD